MFHSVGFIMVSRLSAPVGLLQVLLDSGRRSQRRINDRDKRDLNMHVSKEMRRASAVSNSSIFGPNAWLIDEQFQQYSKDPNSVDKEWREYFKANGAPRSATQSPAAVKQSEGSSIEAKQAARETSTSAAAADAQASTKKAAPVPDKPAPKKSAAKKPQSPLERIGEAPEPGETQLKGMFKAIAKNMDESLTIPTATTVRDMPVKLMWENRALINDHLKRTRGGKISFTHILGYAMVKAVQIHPAMNVRYENKDGKPFVVQPEHVNLGLAIDLPQKDGSRALVVAAIKDCEHKSFAEFLDAYEDIVARSRKNKLTMDDFSGVTINLTNPGGIGTRHSIARLAEAVMEIILCMNSEMSADEATLLYIGLTTDTGCFQYSNTCAASFRAAAELLRMGADNTMVSTVFFRKVSRARLKLESMIYAGMTYYRDGLIAVAKITLDMMARAGATEDDCDDLAGLPGRAEGSIVNITVREQEDGTSKISVRSTRDVNSSDICAVFGGGGHAMAAGCTIYGGPDKATETLLSVIDEVWK